MAYYIFGVGLHTEEDCAPRNQTLVGYRPLYQSDDFPAGPFHFNRPLEMFYDGDAPRFTPITDEATLAELKRVYLEMYPHPF